MPYTLPTAEEFTTRFPIFADKDETLITIIIAEASSSVDTEWEEADYQPAIMYLAAHLLATDNSEEGSAVEIGNGSSGAIASESFGPLSVSYASGGAADDAASKSQWGSTSYGRRYYNLLRRNKTGIVVV